MALLQRITTQYVDSEDRIKLSGITESGETSIIWLSQRLLLRVLPHCFSWLEKKLTSSAGRDIFHSLELDDANSEQAQNSPVLPTKGCLQCLADSIDLNYGFDILSIQFRANSELYGHIQFNAMQLRQWLNILRALWRLAEWPTDVWPNWFFLDLQSSEKLIHFYH